ncbi:MAG: 30S ribosomal protein S20 [Planctomycetes bacterium]|nr:30S ribosomal protein S20 [Planctomycetota bacterium]
MAHSLSARKRARQGVKRKIRNQTVKSQIKTHVKKLRLMLTATDKKTDKDNLTGKIKESYKLIDQAVSKGVIHKNKAARLKSRLTRAANKVGQK